MHIIPLHVSYHLVSETFYPETNGVAMTLRRLTLGLHKRNIPTTVIRPRQKEETPNEHPYREHLVTGVPIPTYPDLRFGITTTGKLKELWREERPSLIHVATEGPLGLCAVMAARSLNIPVISSFHTNFHQYGNYYRYSFLIKIVLGYLRYLHNKTEATYAPSDDLIQTLIDSGFRNVKKLGRGVDAELFSPEKRSNALRKSWGVSENTTVFAYIGRVAHEKNIPLAIESFNQAKAIIPDAKMVIVGDGPQREVLECKYSDLIFCGMQKGEALAEHYASADVFLSPSITETFGNVITEAMASGLLVATYDYAAGKMFIKHGKNGISAPFDNEEIFKKRIIELTNNRNCWPAMRKAARKTILSASWDNVIDDYLHTLEDYLP